MARKGKEAECIAIAQDAIAQINAGKYVPQNLNYFSLAGVDTSKLNPTGREEQIVELQEAINAARKCTVCAVGSIFASIVRLKDDYTVSLRGYTQGYLGDQPASTNRWLGGDAMRNRINEYFKWGEVKQMENVFEMWSESNRRKILARYPTPQERMLAILENIIENNGSFSLLKFRKNLTLNR